ncbi:MAG: hypothetical protein Q8P24_11445 [Desulfobacterales bacterium]|nr:hypothetical protein [Desulfobacterales bacterium]
MNRKIRQQRGALLITLIVTMATTAVLGSSMLSYFSISSYGEHLSNRQERAYYLGESGANYALQKFIANKVTNGPFPTLTTFTVGNDQFAVKTYDKPGDSSRLMIESTGIVGTGWLATRQLITRDIKKSTATLPGQSSTASVGFDLSGSGTLDNTWTLTPGTDAKIVNTGPSGGGAVQFKGLTGGINFNWYNNPPAPDLLAAWNNNGNLLSYSLQVKVLVDRQGGKGEYYMMGLSFRVIDDNNSYGISFYRSNGTSGPSWWSSSAFANFRATIPNNGKNYAVLWKKIAGTYTVLDYTLMTYNLSGNYADVVTDATSDRLSDRSSIIIRVREEFDGPGGARQNHLIAYVQGPTNYPSPTVHWQYSAFKRISWTWTLNPPQPNPPITEVLDGSLTSENFSASRPELGIHSFYDSLAANDAFFADFGLGLTQGGGGGGIQF